LPRRDGGEFGYVQQGFGPEGDFRVVFSRGAVSWKFNWRVEEVGGGEGANPTLGRFVLSVRDELVKVRMH